MTDADVADAGHGQMMLFAAFIVGEWQTNGTAPLLVGTPAGLAVVDG